MTEREKKLAAELKRILAKGKRGETSVNHTILLAAIAISEHSKQVPQA